MFPPWCYHASYFKILVNVFISELQVHTSLVSESFVALTPAVSRLHVERRVRPAEILYTPLSGWEPEKEGCVSRLSALPSEKKLPFCFHSFHFDISFPSFNNFLVLFHFYLPIHIFFLSSIEMLHVFFLFLQLLQLGGHFPWYLHPTLNSPPSPCFILLSPLFLSISDVLS